MAAPSPCLVLTGPSGSGKSTLCGRLADDLRAAGRPCGGVITARRDAQDGRGLDVIDIRSRTRLPLAEFDRLTGGPVTGRWHFHAEAFATGVAWCLNAPPEALLLVDEIGPLELQQQLGWYPLLAHLAACPGPVLATVRPSLFEPCAAALAGRGVHRIDIDSGCRDTAAARVRGWLGLAP